MEGSIVMIPIRRKRPNGISMSFACRQSKRLVLVWVLPKRWLLSDCTKHLCKLAHHQQR